MTYAILAATAPDTTLHARAREWCDTFCEDWRQLHADGLTTSNTDVQSPHETDLEDLARRVDLDARDLDWTGEVWVLGEPSLLDAETGDPFRRTLRVVLERITEPEARFPYDHLDDADERGRWFERCLAEGEIHSPTSIFGGGIRGVNDRQRDLDTF